MTEHYHVRLEQQRLVFSAAHFITYQGDVCERLHGHNYHVAAEVHGPLDENQYVVDFVALRDALLGLLDKLDHRMMLPTQHPTIHVLLQDQEVQVTHGQRRWIFPAEDCVLLPIANTTAELLARHLGEQLLAVLREEMGFCPQVLQVTVDECDGQTATCQIRLDDTSPRSR